MDYFLASCRANATIDFFLFTDNSRPDRLPRNVHYRQISYNAYLDKVSERLMIDFHPGNPYKLCDLKPALGYIHQDSIADYDFWGFCDIDLIFGQLRHFLTDRLLSRYDLITTHERRIAGHFTIIRNKQRYNRAFKDVRDWSEYLAAEEHKAFDEKAFSRLFVGFKNFPGVLRRPLKWLFLPHGRRALFREAFSTPGLRCDWVDGSRNFPSEWYWQRAKLTNNRSDDEFLYFHFLKWKRDWNGRMCSDVEAEDRHCCWKVTEEGFKAIHSLAR